jgi:hypothetical protein
MIAPEAIAHRARLISTNIDTTALLTSSQVKALVNLILDFAKENAQVLDQNGGKK